MTVGLHCRLSYWRRNYRLYLTILTPTRKQISYQPDLYDHDLSMSMWHTVFFSTPDHSIFTVCCECILVQILSGVNVLHREGSSHILGPRHNLDGKLLIVITSGYSFCNTLCAVHNKQGMYRHGVPKYLKHSSQIWKMTQLIYDFPVRIKTYSMQYQLTCLSVFVQNVQEMFKNM